MRLIRYLFLAALAVVLMIIAVANRGDVTLTLLPEELSIFAGTAPTVSLPLFLVIFLSIVAGILIGFVWEWMREYKHRAAASSERAAKEKLEREVSRLKGPGQDSADAVLALLDEPKPAR